MHARLPYKEFTRTKFYQSTHTSRYLLFVAEFLASIVLIIIPYFLMVGEANRIIGVFALFIALPAGIFMLVNALSGFSSTKKFKTPEKPKAKAGTQAQKS